MSATTQRGTRRAAAPNAEARRKRWYPVGTVIVVAVFLLIWQFAPQVPFLVDVFRFLNPFTISSPTRVAVQLWDLMFAHDGTPSVWPYLWNTVFASIVGLLIGLALGLVVALIFAESEATFRIFSPIITLINSAPRVALIPIVILITGPTLTASVVSSVLVVFFLGLFNALEGARGIPRAIRDNSTLFGASRLGMSAYIRLPSALALIFAALPNAISFSLIAVVTSEILTGAKGMGQLVVASQISLDSDLTIAVVIMLSLVGSAMVALGVLSRKYVLRWERHT